jgi:rubrerythrin
MVNDNSASKTWPLQKLKVLDICQQIHKHAEEVYQYLSALHQEDTAISRIFGELAVDKCNLSDAFKMASKLKGSGLSDICVSPEMASDQLNKMKSVLKWIQSNPVSVVHALRFAIRMEESLEPVHILNVVRFYYEQDMALMTSNLKKSSNNLHVMTEEYMNLTLFEQEGGEMF